MLLSETRLFTEPGFAVPRLADEHESEDSDWWRVDFTILQTTIWCHGRFGPPRRRV
jgi:hypothetical protein